MSTSNMTVSSMAEELSQQTLMVNKHVPVVDGISKDELSINLSASEKIIISGEVLQPPVNETGEYDQNVFEQNRSNILQENIHPLSDHSYIHTTKSPTFESMNTEDLNSVGSPIAPDKDVNKNLELHNLSFETDKCVSDSSGNHLKSLSLNEDNEINLNNESLTFNAVEGSCSEDFYANETIVSSNPLIISENPVSSNSSSDQTVCALPSSSVSSSNNFALSNLKFLTTKKTNAPLGSVENPIQITHKGDSFETTQVLTQAQLQQISYVLQNQRANRIQNGGRSVLFDPTTNTRIVCRIVHPSELQGTNSTTETASKPTAIRRASSSRGKGRHRRTDDDDRGTNLTKEEREERKKQRPRTRSGRISKPPSYMVKDYKRIHHLDFNEDVYDSDGGYSDYHLSDEETVKSGTKEEVLPPGVTTSKQRNYACQKCPKAYIGKGGLSRHYRLNPSHGSMQEGEDVSTQDENSSSSLASSVLSSSGGQNNSQNGTTSFPQVSVRFETEGSLEKAPQLPSSGQVNAILSARRKSKLKEILKSYSDEELIDAILPDLAQKVSLWDFFLKKCDEKSDGLRIYEMLKEFEKFLVEMQKISHAYLSPASYEDHGKTIINISSKQIAEALSLERGAYFVNDPSTTISNAAFSESLSGELNQSGDIIQPHAKRKRIDQNVEDISSGLPDQILSDVHESGNIDLPLSEVSFPVNSDFQRQDNHIFSSALTAVDPQNDLASKSLFDLSSSTTVTPSSLSSGCLSAVNTSKSEKMNMLFTTNGAQQLHNLQIRKVQLLGTESQQQVLVKNSTRMSLNGFTLPPDFNLNEISSNKTICMNNREVEVDCSNLTAKSTFQTLNLSGNIDILSQGLQESVGICNNQATDHSLSDLSHVNNTHISNESQITDTQKVQDEVSKNIVNCLPLVDVQNPATIVSDNEIQTCLPPDITTSSNTLEESREFEIPPSDIASESTKTTDSSQILRHFVLPDGQLIGVWSPADSSEKSVNEQLVQNCLPGNLIIVQNPDGTIQVPSNQNLTLETLQTFVSVDPGQTTSTYTTVHM
ncbi:uncharacterized protein LOC129984501 [Argiope bruennichi]|uniref:uncharacterized protein LOC129984501 n=1 Tax=Argiope bruennichi TaxID=94029 RepID=UPI002495112E|nr:uncharacterized protein LOC129984501 [Argiope bruennichi]